MAKATEVPGLGPETPRAHAAARLLAARVADVRREEAAAARLDADAVHDMRVAIRRLRAALWLFGGARRRALGRELKPLQDALGAVRDPQVQRRWLARARGIAPAARAALVAHALRPLPAASRALRAALERFEEELAGRLELDAAVERGRGKLGGRKVRRRVARRLARVEELARAAAEDGSPEAAHALRIAVKKLRYACELAEPAFGAAARGVLEALVPLQEGLGELHDADVRAERLLALAAGGSLAERAAARALLPAVRRERKRRWARLARTLAGWRAEGLFGALEAQLGKGRR